MNDSYDPYKATYGSMPSHAACNPEIKQLYVNGHFCYVYKFSMVTNSLGIVRDISFYNKNFFNKHPSIEPNTFIGDVAFDTTNIYRDLLTDLKFDKAF